MGKSKIAWPSTDELIEKLKTTSYTHLGRMLGVSRHTIKRYLKSKGIVPPITNPLGDILELKLTKRQQEIIAGHLLGDGTVALVKGGTANSFLAIERMRKDKQYLAWTSKELKEFCNPINIRDYKHFTKENNATLSSRFATRSHPIFTELRQKWYPEGEKIVPDDIVLTPLVVAVWFCDDGCISHQKKDGTYICQFSTQSFVKNEVVRLCDLLNEALHLEKLKIGKLHLSQMVSPTTGNTQYYIRGANNATKTLLRYVIRAMPDGMNRKVKRWLHLLDKAT